MIDFIQTILLVGVVFLLLKKGKYEPNKSIEEEQEEEKREIKKSIEAMMNYTIDNAIESKRGGIDE